MIMGSAAGFARVHWTKSRYSGTSGNCVEFAVLNDGGCAIRDSKNPAGPVLKFPPAAWSAFTAGIRSSQFD
jgi:hypothetical protein